MRISTAESAGTRMAVDVRRFGWIRPLAGEYAFNFAAVAPLFAGDPTKPESWREAITRARSIERHPAEIAQLMGWSEAKTRNLIYRGLADLRERLASEGVGWDSTGETTW